MNDGCRESGSAHKFLVVELPRVAVELCKRPRLEARIDRLAFESQHTEDAFMYPAERLLSDKSFKSFNAKSKLAECQRAFG